MFALLLIVPATGIAIAGYVALYVSSRSEGTLKCLGKYLGIWAFVLAVLLGLASLAGVSYHVMHRGLGGPGMMYRGMHGFGPGFGSGFGPGMMRYGRPPFDGPPPPPPGGGQPPVNAPQPQAAPASPPAP